MKSSIVKPIHFPDRSKDRFNVTSLIFSCFLHPLVCLGTYNWEIQVAMHEMALRFSSCLGCASISVLQQCFDASIGFACLYTHSCYAEMNHRELQAHTREHCSRPFPYYAALCLQGEFSTIFSRCKIWFNAEGLKLDILAETSVTWWHMCSEDINIAVC
jgi:hypothetical protein